jgi:hypothetical protein
VTFGIQIPERKARGDPCLVLCRFSRYHPARVRYLAATPRLTVTRVSGGTSEADSAPGCPTEHHSHKANRQAKLKRDSLSVLFCSGAIEL